MPGNPTIRALERGLGVLEALHGLRSATLRQLHDATRLPKPTLLRVIRTLERAGYLRRGLNDGLYRSSVKLSRLAPEPGDGERLIEAAAPVLNRLQRAAVWPSDLAVHRGDAMVIVESSRLLSPFHISRVGMNFRIGVTSSALGRVFLAHCAPERRRTILARLRRSDSPLESLARMPRQLDRVLRQTRAQGYGTRDRDYKPETTAIAVPIFDGARVIGGINIVWVTRAVPLEQMVAAHLGELQAAAQEISARLAAFGGAGGRQTAQAAE